MANDITLELQRKIEALERKNKLLEEGLHQAERLRQMYDRTAQELKSSKSLLIRHSAELAESESRFREIFNTVNDAIFIHDAQTGRIVEVNQRMCEMYGITRDEALASGPDDLSAGTPPYSSAEASEKIRLARTEGTQIFEWQARARDGHLFWVEVSLRFALIGSQQRILAMVRDITERKQIELKLQESEERFRKAFQNSAIGMALVGLDGHWLKVNHSLCQIVGYSEPELLSKTFQDITHPDDLQTDLDFVAQLLAGERDHYQMEKRYFHKDGHIVWIRLSVSLIRDAQDNPIHFVSQIDDITEDKLVDEKIRQLNEELETKVRQRTRQLLDTQDELVRREKLAVLGQVAGSVGHELRNPLGVMNNAVFFLQTVLSDADETTREYLNIIKDEIAASERIVSDLLDSVRTKPSHPERLALAELMQQTLRKCSVPSSVVVKLDIPATLAPLRVDPLQIHQVLRNLISNGIEAMPEGGVLEISAIENNLGGTITVSVKDSGIGMTPEQLGKLFQPLFTTKARGVGLGLVVVKNLTEANGGKISVESEVGKGTLFTVTLPATEETGVSI